MAPRRLISCCLGLAAAGLLLLGCGSSGDPKSADIDPNTATDLSGQLDRIQAFFEEGNCDRAIGAVDNMGVAIDKVSGQTGEQFTTDAQELVSNLRSQVEDECDPAEETTSSSTTETTDTEPIVTDTEPTETSTSTTTTKSTTTTTSTTTTPTPPTGPGNSNGNGNGPATPPGGGISPGGKKKTPDAQIKKPKPKKDKDKGGKHEKDKEHGR